MSDQTSDVVEEAPARRSTGLRDIASRLYQGEAGVDVVGKRKIYYAVAGIIVLVAIVTFLVRPFNLGIEFKGGESFSMPASIGTLDDARAAFTEQGAEVASAQKVGGTNTANDTYLIKTPVLDPDPAVASTKATKIKQGVAQRFHLPENAISESSVSGSWGSSVTTAAGIGALVFLVLVMVYLAWCSGSGGCPSPPWPPWPRTSSSRRRSTC